MLKYLVYILSICIGIISGAESAEPIKFDSISTLNMASEIDGHYTLEIVIMNITSNSVKILKDLDSINIPRNREEKNDTLNSNHYDYGVSDKKVYKIVEPNNCIIISKMINDDQLQVLKTSKRIIIPVGYIVNGEEKVDLIKSKLWEISK